MESRGGGKNRKLRRLDLSTFDGGGVDDWILKADQYFSFYNLNEKEKMEALVVSFVGEAMMGYKWERQRMPLRNWEDLKS